MFLLVLRIMSMSDILYYFIHIVPPPIYDVRAAARNHCSFKKKNVVHALLFVCFWRWCFWSACSCVADKHEIT